MKESIVWEIMLMVQASLLVLGLWLGDTHSLLFSVGMMLYVGFKYLGACIRCYKS